MYTIDASVWINAVSPTELSFKQSMAFLELILKTRTEIVLPTLLTVEVVATIARRSVRNGPTGEIADLFSKCKTFGGYRLMKRFLNALQQLHCKASFERVMRSTQRLR